MTPQERLEAAIERACAPYNAYMSSFEDIQEHYKDTYKPRERVRAMVNDMYGLTPANGKEYKAARRNVERWAQGKTHPDKNAQRALADLGKKLPPTAKGVPPDGLTVKVKGKFNPSPKRKAKGEQPREREIEFHFSGANAIDFVNNPSLVHFFEMYGVDGEQFVDMLDESADIAVG
jgi:hypothetical protein